MNYTATRRSVHIRYTYADSSFAKGAFGKYGKRAQIDNMQTSFLVAGQNDQ